jgi:hypothetical protein
MSSQTGAVAFTGVVDEHYRTTCHSGDGLRCCDESYHAVTILVTVTEAASQRVDLDELDAGAFERPNLADRFDDALTVDEACRFAAKGRCALLDVESRMSGNLRAFAAFARMMTLAGASGAK